MIRALALLLLTHLSLLAQPPGPPSSRPTNRLAKEQSPYLRQHRHNPVNWYPWGPEAFAAAKKTGKPIFLSIGYAACHWCHVMERESFEDEEVARHLNEHFIAIKVDREERPDVDQIYMDACRFFQDGNGGWPLSGFLTPERVPFFVGTYYTKPQLLSLLRKTVQLWKTNREALVGDAEATRAVLVRLNAPQAMKTLPSQLLERGGEDLLAREDPRFGGFGHAPKFPRVAAPLLLLRRHFRRPDPRLEKSVRRMLDAMAKGGLRDHLQGGFHRYCVDQRWFVPHFEKMLYDQALLAQLYLEAGQLLEEPRYLDVAREILDQLLEVFRREDGSFIASLDADTGGVEGATYTWTKAELTELLTPSEFGVVERWAEIDAEGNWEHGRNILHEAHAPKTFAAELKLDATIARALLSSAKRKLLKARDARPQPARDTKVLCGWNALAIASLAQAAPVLGERYLVAAGEAMNALDQRLLQKDGRYLRSFAGGKARHPGTLFDHAAVLRAKLELYRQSFDERWLEGAHSLGMLLFDAFGEKGSLVDSKSADLITRTTNLYDGALPSGFSLALEAWVRLGQTVVEPVWEERARKAFLSAAGSYRRAPAGSPWALIALDLLQGPSPHLSLRGKTLPASWLRTLRTRYRPDLRLFWESREGEAEGRVCVERRCLPSSRNFEELLKQLARPSDEAKTEGR